MQVNDHVKLLDGHMGRLQTAFLTLDKKGKPEWLYDVYGLHNGVLLERGVSEREMTPVVVEEAPDA